tara:strand:+ start:364 stop:636 length:273 start_codon:yes stop_codon:yes gene_type:complete
VCAQTILGRRAVHNQEQSRRNNSSFRNMGVHTRRGAACWRLAKASASSGGPPLSKQACRALLASLPLSRQATPLLYTCALLASAAAVPDD